MLSLGKLGENATYIDENGVVEKYVCSLYGQGTSSSVNEARLKIFLQKYKTSNEDSPLEKIKGIDAGMVPLCRNVLMLEISRSNFVAYL